MEIVLQRDQTPSSQSKMQETPDYLQIGAEVSENQFQKNVVHDFYHHRFIFFQKNG